jgi:hypothetical protein
MRSHAHTDFSLYRPLPDLYIKINIYNALIIFNIFKPIIKGTNITLNAAY